MEELSSRYFLCQVRLGQSHRSGAAAHAFKDDVESHPTLQSFLFCLGNLMEENLHVDSAQA